MIPWAWRCVNLAPKSLVRIGKPVCKFSQELGRFISVVDSVGPGQELECTGGHEVM